MAFAHDLFLRKLRTHQSTNQTININRSICRSINWFLELLSSGETSNEQQAKEEEQQQQQQSDDEKEKLTKIEDVELEKKPEEKLETKDVGKQDDQPPNADDQKA